MESLPALRRARPPFGEPARPSESPPALWRAHLPFGEPTRPPPSPPAPMHPTRPLAHPGPLYGGWPASCRLTTPLTLVPPSTLAACLPSTLTVYPVSMPVCPPLYGQPARWAAEHAPRARPLGCLCPLARHRRGDTHVTCPWNRPTCRPCPRTCPPLRAHPGPIPACPHTHGKLGMSNGTSCPRTFLQVRPSAHSTTGDAWGCDGRVNCWEAIQGGGR